MKGSTGTSLGTVYLTKEALARRRKARMKETARWNRKNGPVRTYHDPSVVRTDLPYRHKKKTT
jgi:hypothetical protein